MTDPGKYKRFARKNDEGGAGVDFVYGITDDGKSELQAVRFDASKFTAAEAKKWCADHDKKPILFEAATGEEKREEGEEFAVRGYRFEDMSFRSYPLSPATWRDEDRGVEAVLATEKPALVKDMKRQRIVLEVLRMDGIVLPADGQLPLQDAHSRQSVRHTLGSTVNLRVENGQLLGRNVISSAEADVATKIREGHIRKNSLGYVPLDGGILEPGMRGIIGGIEYCAAKLPLLVETRWAPMENSLLAVGADDDAKFRCSVWGMSKEETTMATENKPATETAAKAEGKPAEAAKPEAETERAIEVPPIPNRRDALAEITPRGWDALLDAAIVEGLTVEQYRARLREELTKRQKPVGTGEPPAPRVRALDKIGDEEFRRAF